MSQPTTGPTTTPDANKSGAGSDKDDVKGTGTDSGADKSKTMDPEDVTGLKNSLKAVRKERDEFAKAAREAELAKLPELERYKSEAEENGRLVEKLTAENLRMRVGMELGLKWSIAKRLSGDTEDEIRADAADMLKYLKSDDDKGSGKDDKKDRDAANKVRTNDGGKGGSAGKPDLNTLFRAAAGRTAS
jgi:hypothetical protein